MKLFRPILPLVLLTLNLAAAEGDRDRFARLRLPWDAMQGVLKLDDQEVRLRAEEFQALLAQTGGDALPRQTLTNGEVILSREEFTRLINSLQPPPAAGSARVILTKGDYQARLSGATVEVTATIRLEALNHRGKPLSVDILPGHLAFTSVLLDERPAPTTVSNGRLNVTVDSAGGHTLTVRYAVPAESAERTQQISIPLAETPITRLRLDLPEPQLDATVVGALRTETEPLAGATRVIATLPRTGNVSVSWNPMAPSAAKGPAQIYVETHHQLSIEDDAFRARTQLDLQILQNTLNRLTMDVPAGHSVLDVQGENIAEWREQDGKLDVFFRHAIKGRQSLQVLTEEVLVGTRAAVEFTGIAVRGALRERGTIGVDVKGAAEVAAPGLNNLDRIDVLELPGHLVGRTTRQAFRFARPPFRLGLEITRHENVETVVCAVQNAQLTTLILDDGRRVQQAVYLTKNTTKQFMELQLPEGVRLWSAFVAGEPVKPTDAGQGKVKIPLRRSEGRGDVLRAFPVEIVYMDERAPLGFLQRPTLTFPMPDVVVSRVDWTLYMPPELRYKYFGKAFQPAPELYTQATAVRSAQGGFGKGDKAGFARGQVAEAMVMGDETDSEEAKGQLADRDDGPADRRAARQPMAAPALKMMEFMAKKSEAGNAGNKPASPAELAGVLPIRVNVPLQGTRLRFGKTLPELGRPLELPLWAYHRSLYWVGIALLVIAAAAALYRWRATLLNLGLLALAPVKERLPDFSLLFEPGAVAFSSAVLALLLAAWAAPLALLGLLLFSGSLTWWLVSLVRGGRS